MRTSCSGTWPASLNAGYTDLVWYLMVNEGAPVGRYGIDVGIQGGTDLAETAYVSFAAPDAHGQTPPDNGDDTTTPPVVMITIDAITTDSASFSFVANEDGATLQTLLAVDGVKGAWEDAATGTKTYTGLVPGDYVFYVKATDVDGNAATYLKKFTIEPVVTTTTLALSKTSRAFGTASTATATVTGTPGTATGSVTFKDGTKVLGTKALAGGTAAVTLPKTLAVGKHSITAVYAGTVNNLPSTSAAKVLTVTKAVSTTKATLKKSTIKVGKHGRMTVTVTAIGTTPTGKVRIKDGAKVLKTVTLTNGTVRITLPKLKKGKHSLKVTYRGSASVTGDSTRVTLRVRA